MSSASKKLVYIDGEPRWLSAEERQELGLEPRPAVSIGVASGYGEGNPGRSISMSIHPSQCDLMNDEIRRAGIAGVHYDPSKRHNCVITSRKGRADWMKRFGELTRLGKLHDNDGGYGDG